MDTQTQEHNTVRNQNVVEEYFRDLADRNASFSRTAKRAATEAGVYAAIWAPVAIGVGYTLIKVGKKVFSPTAPIT